MGLDAGKARLFLGYVAILLRMPKLKSQALELSVSNEACYIAIKHLNEPNKQLPHLRKLFSFANETRRQSISQTHLWIG